MRPWPKERALRAAALVSLVSALVAAESRALDEELYATILERHTITVDDIASTRVDYGALRNSEAWRTLLRSLGQSDPRRLRSRNEKLAFWINAYNIFAIDLVRRHYPIDSIRSIGGFFSPVWKKAAGEIAGRVYTLHEIEHEILRPMADPRIHAAIVCASLSCPPLRREPYRPGEIDEQLDDNVRRWLADPRKGLRIDRSTRTLYLSPILDWFDEDFGDDVLAFVAPALPTRDANWIRTQGRTARIRYFDYDWRVNDVVAGSALSRAPDSGGGKTTIAATATVAAPVAASCAVSATHRSLDLVQLSAREVGLQEPALEADSIPIGAALSILLSGATQPVSTTYTAMGDDSTPSLRRPVAFPANRGTSHLPPSFAHTRAAAVATQCEG